MRNRILYLTLFTLFASCTQKEVIPIQIYPLQINFYGKVEQLSNQLDTRNAQLVYENSFSGEDKGVKFYYFDDENDSLHYHFEIYTINDRIEGINGSISSKNMEEESLYEKVEKEIVIKFKSSTSKLLDEDIEVERLRSEDVRGKIPYYHFEIKTKALQEKMK